jgi:hypothetical protein
MPRRLRLLLPVLFLVGRAATAQVGEPARDEVPLEDLLEIVVLSHELVAIDATAGDINLELHLGEKVQWKGTRGRVGIALTGERMLAVSTGSSTWAELRYLNSERPPTGASLGDRVALITTNQRAIGFVASTGRLAEYRLGPQEVLRDSGVAANVGVVITNRLALGLSSEAGGFFTSKLQLKEKIRSLEMRANVGMIRTDRRLLTFRGPSGTWSERRLDLVDQGG